MKHTKILIVLGTFLFNACSAYAATTVIHAGTLLTTAGDAISHDSSIIIVDGVIQEIKDGFVEPEPSPPFTDIEVINLSDSFVMAGFIDAHVHLTFKPGLKGGISVSNSDLAVLAAANARTTLIAGITTVRDLGAKSAEAIFAVRDAIANGTIPGPRIIAAGETVTATAGHGDWRNLRPDVAALLYSDAICDGADDCRRAVRAQYKKGADVIKVHATGGGADPNGRSDSTPEMTPSELLTIVETAHALNLKVAAHAHGTLGIKSALDAGVDSIEHSTWVDKEVISLYRKSGAAMVRTAYLQDYFLSRENIPEDAQERRRQRNTLMDPGMRDAIKSGVNIVMGTDAGIMPHGMNAREMIKYVQLGMSPMQALASATTNAAELLNLADEVGQIKPGFSADIIAMGSNPIEDISAVEDVNFVMKSGVIYLDKSN